MLTRFLVPARSCYAVDPQRISEAGGHFVGIGRVEDDGTVTVDVDVSGEDVDTSRRLSAMFAPMSVTV
jgi:hypothetical protein